MNVPIIIVMPIKGSDIPKAMLNRSIPMNCAITIERKAAKQAIRQSKVFQYLVYSSQSDQTVITTRFYR